MWKTYSQYCKDYQSIVNVFVCLSPLCTAATDNCTVLSDFYAHSFYKMNERKNLTAHVRLHTTVNRLTGPVSDG